MKLNRKLCMVAMVIFAVLLCTTNVYAANLAVNTTGDGSIQVFGWAFNETEVDAVELTPQSNGTYKLNGEHHLRFIMTPGDHFELGNVLMNGCEFDYVPIIQNLPPDDDYPANYICDNTTPSHLSQTSDGIFYWSKPPTGTYDPQGGNYTFEAVFTAIPQITYNASAGPNGSISPVGSFSLDKGSSTTFTITPDTLYQVADVLVDGASIGAVTSVPFDNSMAGHTIIASFEPIPVVADFTADMTSGEITTIDEVTFTDASQGNLTSWEWYVNRVLNPEPVLISSNPEPLVLQFSADGVYTVTLVVRNDATSSDYSAAYEVISSYTSDPVTVEGSQVGYKSIMGAYNSIPVADAKIKMKAGEITEDLDFDDPVIFELKGGYSQWDGSDDGYTKIRGNVKISYGKVTVSKVIIAPVVPLN